MSAGADPRGKGGNGNGGEIVRLDAVVHGAVQGVGFRWFVIRVAGGMGLKGWVANERDGTVRCVAEGPRAQLDRLLGELQTGPAGASVEDVVATWLPASGGLEGFTVRASWHRGD